LTEGEEKGRKEERRKEGRKKGRKIQGGKKARKVGGRNCKNLNKIRQTANT
jgi:hypothetical protein